MQKVMIFDCDHLFDAGNFRRTQVNQFSHFSLNLSNKVNNEYLKCLKKSRKLLKGLEHSLAKTREYEDELTQCRRDHVCKHLREKVSGETVNVYPTTAKAVSPGSHKSFSGSSSTISLVELQYQYVELCDRYDSLLSAFDRHCHSDVRALQLRSRIHKTHTELAQLHRSLMGMGITEKYLTLKYKKTLQKTRYKDRIAKLKQTLPELLAAVETKHREFSARLSQLSCLKYDASVTLLVAEMSKSNDLLLENIRLKTKLEMLTMD